MRPCIRKEQPILSVEKEERAKQLIRRGEAKHPVMKTLKLWTYMKYMKKERVNV